MVIHNWWYIDVQRAVYGCYATVINTYIYYNHYFEHIGCDSVLIVASPLLGVLSQLVSKPHIWITQLEKKVNLSY